MPKPRTGSGGASVVAKAVAGAAAGATAVYVFDKLDWFMYRHEDAAARRRTKAVRPAGQAPAEVIATRLAKAVNLSPSAQKPLGPSIHYALGVGPGVAYGVLHKRARYIGAGRGTLFGLSLFLFQDELLNTVMKTSAKPQRYPWQAHARGLVSHLVYGLVLDTLVRGADRAMQARLTPVERLQADLS